MDILLNLIFIDLDFKITLAGKLKKNR